MDTLGPSRTKSIQGFNYNTTFTDGATGSAMSYGHASTAQVAEIQERWYADTARLRELHGDPRVLRCDNASVNVSARATQFRVSKNIRTETCCPYESNQMGTAERMNRTLETTGRTVLLASGLDKRWWHHAIMYATYTHNLQYSRVSKSSPHLLMYGDKPDVSSCQQFGCEGWLHRRVDQRPDSSSWATPPISKDSWSGVLIVVRLQSSPRTTWSSETVALAPRNLKSKLSVMARLRFFLMTSQPYLPWRRCA